MILLLLISYTKDSQVIFVFKAFTTLVNNALQIAVINGFGDFILFLGKCFVTATTGSVSLLLLRSDPDLEFYAIPVLIVCVFSFFIAHCLISLYEVSLRFFFYMCFIRKFYSISDSYFCSHDFRPLSTRCSYAYAKTKI